MNLEQIDTSTTAGKARVMQLAADGRKVATTNLSGEWQECSLPEWAWDSYDYAIIAEAVGPEEVWGLIHADGSVLALSSNRLEAAERQSLVRYRRADLAGEVKP